MGNTAYPTTPPTTKRSSAGQEDVASHQTP